MSADKTNHKHRLIVVATNENAGSASPQLEKMHAPGQLPLLKNHKLARQAC